MDCIAEFGPHTTHNDCQRMLRDMQGSTYTEGAYDESTWYANRGAQGMGF